MNRRWMVLVAVLGLMPMLMAMRSVDEKLLKAALKGDQKQVQGLLKKGAEVKTPDSDGFTPLFIATQMKHTAIADGLGRTVTPWLWGAQMRPCPRGQLVGEFAAVQLGM